MPFSAERLRRVTCQIFELVTSLGWEDETCFRRICVQTRPSASSCSSSHGPSLCPQV